MLTLNFMITLKNLTVIMVTFQTDEKILYNCLNSINNNVKILIIENSKNIEFKRKIENIYRNVKVILSGKNLGYGGGNNLGLKHLKTRFALISNPDVIYNDNFFEEIKLYLSEKINFSVIGPSYIKQYPGMTPPYRSFDQTINNKKFNDNYLKEVDYVIGCSMLLDIKNINLEFYFDENFFIYFEEADLCRRIKLNDGKVFCSSKLLIHHEAHKGSSATNTDYAIESDIFRNWHWMWSAFYYNKKYSSYTSAFFLMIGKFFKSFIKMILFTILYNKKQQAIYYARFSGLYNSMIGKKSWYRVKSLIETENQKS